MKNNKIISILADDETNVVERVLECLSSQGLSSNNIFTSKTFDNKIIINITLQLDENILNKVLNKLEKLIPVYSAQELNEKNSLSQQLALIKINTNKMSKNMIDNIINNKNISIILPLGAENKNDITILSEKYNNIIVRIAENRKFIEGFINNYKKAIVEIVRTSDLTIAIK